MKNKDLNRLAHFLLQKETLTLIRQMKIKEKIDSDSSFTDTDKMNLYSEVIESISKIQKTTIRIMTAAADSEGIRFTDEDLCSKSINDIEKRFGVKTHESKARKEKATEDKSIENSMNEIASILAEKMGLNSADVKAVKLPSDVGEELAELFTKLEKTQEKK